MTDLGEAMQNVAGAITDPIGVASGAQAAIQRAMRQMTVWRMSVLTATWLSAYGGLPEPPLAIRRIIGQEEAQYTLLWMLLYQGTADGDWALATVATAGIYALIKGLDAYEAQRKK